MDRASDILELVDNSIDNPTPDPMIDLDTLTRLTLRIQKDPHLPRNGSAKSIKMIRTHVKIMKIMKSSR